MKKLFILLNIILIVKFSNSLIWENEDSIIIEASESDSSSSGRTKRQIHYPLGLLFLYPAPAPEIIYQEFPFRQVEIEVGQRQNGSECQTTLGEEGECLTFKECYPFVQNEEDELTKIYLKAAGQCKNSYYGAGNQKIKICCSWKRERAKPDYNPSIKPPFESFAPPPACGKFQIIGGSQAKKGQFPWMAALMNNGRNQFCGGSLIDRNHILTAAHCVSRLNSRDTANLRIFLGDHHLYTNNDGPHLVKRVKRIFYNKYFSFKTLYYDIAIIRLDSPAYSNRKDLQIEPICIPSGKENLNIYDDFEGKTIGWGKLGNNRPPSTTLQHANVKIWSNRKCQNYYGRRSLSGIIDSMICSGGRGPDSCQGDSGSSLVVYNSKYQYWKQIGITSWGIDCGQRPGFFPGVYTRVSEFTHWINKNRQL